MAESKSADNEKEISRDRLAELLNEDLSREYQAIIGYVVYSQVLKGAAYMNIADQLALHAKQELDHALTISRQIDYLGKMPTVTPKLSEITAIGSGNANLWENSPWQNRFVRS
jgi:bacterioferritin